MCFLFLCFCSTQLFAASQEYCERYARHALEQFEVAKGERCENLNFPVWSMDFSHHYDWCLGVPEAEAERGNELRVSVLRECRNKFAQGTVTGTVSSVNTGEMAALSRDRSCQDYANKAVSQQELNLRKNCGFIGPQWNANYNDHYNWCMHGENLTHTSAGQQERQNALDSCGAGKFTPKPVTPLPIPGPRAVTPLPIPSPPTVTPIPIPKPALDPGLGDKTSLITGDLMVASPAEQISDGTVKAITSPTNRGALVTELLANPHAMAVIQALPNVKNAALQNLAHQTLAGTVVNGSGEAAGNYNKGNMATTGEFSPSSGPKAPEDFDWDMGVFFSPISLPPKYFANGRFRELGDVTVSGVTVWGEEFEEMNRTKSVRLGLEVDSPPTISINVPIMPDKKGEDTCLVTFGLSHTNIKRRETTIDGKPHFYDSIEARNHGHNGHGKKLELLKVNNGLAVTVPCGSPDYSSYADIYVVLKLNGHYTRFGGVTITRL